MTFSLKALFNRAREGKWVSKGLNFLVARGTAANLETGTAAEPKGILASKTVLGTLVAAVYGIGIAVGWWETPEEEWMAIAIPALAGIIALWGRITVKKPIIRA